MSIELHGPAWAWALIVVYVLVVAPFIGGFLRSMYDDWRNRRRR